MARPPPDPLTYYLDENVDGPEMAERLRAGGLTCERHRDHFQHGDADADWIPVVAKRGWVAVTRDVQIGHKPVERHAWITAGAIVLIVRGKNLNTEQMANALIAARAALEHFVSRRTPPMVIHLSANGDFNLVEGGERRGGVKKDAR